MKPYKCRVEYLQSTGTQWIDTGIYPTQLTEVEYRCAVTGSVSNADSHLFGSRISASSEAFDLAYMNTQANGTEKFRFIHGTTTTQETTTSVTASQLANPHTYYMSGTSFKVDGSEKMSFTTTSFTGTYSLWLFGVNSAGSLHNQVRAQRVYKCKIWDNGTLVRDFIPVLDNNGRPAMYDNVSGQLFYNLGTGEFTYGRKIIPVEYLESTGTQYIDTGYAFQDDFAWEIDFEGISDGCTLFGGRTSSARTALLYQRNYGGIDKTTCPIAGYNGQETPFQLEDLRVDRHTIKMSVASNKGSVWVDGSQIYNEQAFTGTYISGTTQALFADKFGTNDYREQTSSKVYALKMWQGLNLVRDFIPCIDENNVPFMFDLVNCKVYENAGIGQFKVGANVEKSGNKNFLRKKLDIFLSTLKKKRPYYCEVEYLESTGTQYIDVEFKMISGQTMTFNGNMMWTASEGSANFFYGYRSVNSAEYHGDMRAFFIYGTNTNPSGRVAIRYGVNTDNSTQTAVTLNTKFNISFDGTNLKVDGTTYATLTQAYTPANYQNMWLFNCNTTGYYSADVNHFVGRIYNWQIGSGGVLVRDFIPVLDWDMTPCMYDKVSGKLFYNQGSGTFQYGREIHYVDYLESTGTQYIDTGIKLTNDHSVELDYQLTQASQSRAGLFGALNMTGSNQGRFGSILSPSNQQLEHGYGAGNDYWQQGLPDTNRHKLYQKKNEIYFDGNLIHTFNTATFNLAINAYLGNFVYTNYTPAKAKYYSSKWWNNDILVRDYLPAIDENGVGFMFDRVQHIIYDNAGTGAFKYPAREVEYLESTGTQYINTGYVPNQNTYVELNAMYTALDSTYRTPLSVRTSDGAANSFTIAGATNTANVYAFGSQYWSGDSGCPIAYTNIKYFMSLKSGVAIFNGVTGNAGTTITPTTLTAYMFARNANGTASNFFKGRIYNCLIKENSTTIKDYIPCFKDGSAGMWDKVEEKAYYNAGTGTFNVGKVKESRWF